MMKIASKTKKCERNEERGHTMMLDDTPERQDWKGGGTVKL